MIIHNYALKGIGHYIFTVCTMLTVPASLFDIATKADTFALEIPRPPAATRCNDRSRSLDTWYQWILVLPIVESIHEHDVRWIDCRALYLDQHLAWTRL